jgi:hypothetical protein
MPSGEEKKDFALPPYTEREEILQHQLRSLSYRESARLVAIVGICQLTVLIGDFFWSLARRRKARAATAIQSR